MNYVLTVINPESQDLLTTICCQLQLPIITILHGEGTATPSIRDYLGIDTLEKRIVLTIATQEQSEALRKAQKRYLDIDAPGHGVTVFIPIKSVGGNATLAYLRQNSTQTEGKPQMDPEHELIICIANRGATDAVMAAARKAGARGGTVLHGKGTGDKNTPKFYNVTISSEKEVILIVASTANRTTIMQAIMKEAGPDSESGTVVFSLPLTGVAGIE